MRAQVYNGADMTLLDKQSVKLEGIVDMKWSPTDNILAMYQQEVGNMPARVSVMQFPEKIELRQKNLFMVSNAAIYWHPQGKYLAVQVRCHSSLSVHLVFRSNLKMKFFNQN